MMDQYFEIKNANLDTILFFRMGDFYEMFHDDAKIVSKELGLTLTSRDKKSDNPIPMAGFPWHALEENLRKMVSKGYKVTLCEQENELRPGAKLLERIVTRVYTPGSLFEENLLDQDKASRLASIIIKKDLIGISIVDVSTSEVWSMEFKGKDSTNQCINELLRWELSEIVMRGRTAKNESFKLITASIDSVSISQHEISTKKSLKYVKEHFQLNDLGSLGLDNSEICIDALGIATSYLSKLYQKEKIKLRNPTLQDEEKIVTLDNTTLKNLELIQTIYNEKEGSLLHSIDNTRTWMGKRRLKNWIMRPLKDMQIIIKRQSAINDLMVSNRRLHQIRESLKGMRDLERLATKLSYGRITSRDMIAISSTLVKMPIIKSILKESNNDYLIDLSENLDVLEHMKLKINSALLEEQPIGIKDGNIFRDNYSDELDDFRKKVTQGISWLNNLEKNERERLEIPSLKVRHNRQFGWFIEVTNTHKNKVPVNYRRKQTMTNAERYITDELKQMEQILFNADEKSKNLEYELFCDLRDELTLYSEQLINIADSISSLDVISSLAHTARSRNWCKPELSQNNEINIVQGRHPVLESIPEYVSNDLKMNEKRRLLLITGPNMGGKSTYLRQNALIVILAQMGSFIPAKRARIGIVDRIFTRVGANDDLRRGRSTFMLEMIEVAHILKRATSKSLILLDEVGRGTSTFDGLSIAWAVCEDLDSRVKARTLFATHYHQLVGLEEKLDGFKNVHVNIAELESGLKFLYNVKDGSCDESYGVQVAALAGLPSNVIERAIELLSFLENKASQAKAGSGQPIKRDSNQASILRYVIANEMESNSISNTDNTDEIGKKIIQLLKNIDPDTLSPKEALENIYTLKNIINYEKD
ncbi:MAG: DNA mismatch repair protein MutS [Methanobacteriota archaeon]|nr:MAG: DNA mismatch repair protein MutS [Euryarchaeota archaeon]